MLITKILDTSGLVTTTALNTKKKRQNILHKIKAS